MFKKVKENTYVVSGKSQFCRVHTPSEDKKYKSEEVEARYRVDLVLAEDEHAQLLKLFSKCKVKQEFKTVPETEEPKFQFRRDAVQNDDGEYIEGPVVIGTDGKPLSKDVLIGNGSDIVVSFNMVMYEHNKQSRGRVVLNGVKVLNLVPYEAPPKEPPPKPDMSVFDSDDDSEIPF